MEPILITLSILIGILAVLQGWQMVSSKRNQHNPNSGQRLDTIISQLKIMERILNDIWDKVK